MEHKTIAIGSDHAGFELKLKLKEMLENFGYKVLDFGTNSTDSVDYPDYGKKVASSVSEGEVSTGVLVCGSGIGMSITANRYRKVRAALVRDIEDALISRKHNDANIIVFGARRTKEEDALLMLKAFLDTPFEGGRHTARIDKLSKLPE